jgi:hypothetical protein
LDINNLPCSRSKFETIILQLNFPATFGYHNCPHSDHSENTQHCKYIGPPTDSTACNILTSLRSTLLPSTEILLLKVQFLAIESPHFLPSIHVWLEGFQNKFLCMWNINLRNFIVYNLVESLYISSKKSFLSNKILCC